MAINPPVDAVDLALPEVVAPGRAAAVRDFVTRRPLGALGAALILLMLVVAILAPVLATHNPLATDYGAMLAPPGAGHWLGTDAHGRDVLSRIVYGSRTALLVGFGASVIGASLGAIIGVGSAYFGGRVDLLLQRVMDIFLSFPLIILALAVVVILGTGVWNVIIAITIPMIPRCALVVRSSALAIPAALSVAASKKPSVWVITTICSSD